MTLDMETVWKILGLVFACGMVWAKLEAIQKDIKRLEEKQDKYNTLQERVAKIEAKLEMTNEFRTSEALHKEI